MNDFYTPFVGLASSLLGQYKQGSVQLKRLIVTAGAKPWSAGGETPVTYELDATVNGIDEKKVDGTRILTSDLVVTTSPRMKLNGAYVEIEPTDRDQVVVRGKQRTIKQIDRIPASGPAIVYKLYVEGP
jgi:hypothetical protein